MSQQVTDKPECRVCKDTEHLTFAAITEDSLTEDREAFQRNELVVLCESHYLALVENTELEVREVAPAPEEQGQFHRTTDDEGYEILYDHEISQQAWLRFDPDTDETDPLQ